MSEPFESDAQEIASLRAALAEAREQVETEKRRKICTPWFIGGVRKTCTHEAACEDNREGNAATRSRLGEAVGLLREQEWAMYDTSVGDHACRWCLACRGYDKGKHKPDCRLDEFFRALASPESAAPPKEPI